MKLIEFQKQFVFANFTVKLAQFRTTGLKGEIFISLGKSEK